MISVVMPTYKTEWETVEKAIGSVVKQSFQDWELVLVDDNPQDSPLKLKIVSEIKKYDSKKIHLLVNDTNRGANYSRNRGIEASIGEYIAFLDSDDEWDEYYLKLIEEAIGQYNPDIISSKYRYVTIDGEFLSSEQRNYEGNMYRDLIYEDCIGPTSAVVIRKDMAMKVGLFDENLSARQDYDMWIRMSKIGAITHYNRIPSLSIYRIGGDTISTRGLIAVEGTEKVLKKILRDSITIGEESRIRYSHYYRCGKTAADRGRFDVATEYFSKALKNKFTLKCLLLFLAVHKDFIYKKIMRIHQKKQIIQ
ncbi:glycosyltransferase [uncultured Acetatifactor sp.]|jgi:glycosyltransferase involved in cell wall biosynthesis|uniref:glycosyltransferase family 2 protein n=2 Tax=uncultured Acetatifactor sp. TaxID=1671927 RepID=UPI00260A99CB|nr:glycosyltransferase [uncultured Acetatifactor sp.]